MQNLDLYNSMIPVGSAHGITKKELGNLWGLDVKGNLDHDRKYRRILRLLRTRANGDGMVIVSDHHKSKVFRSNKLADILPYRNTVASKGKSTLALLTAIDHIIREQSSSENAELVTINRMKELREKSGRRGIDVVNAMKTVDPSFDEPMLSKMENNRCRPTPQHNWIFCQLYGCTAEDLIKDTIISKIER